MIIISDTSPLNYLGLLGMLSILPRLFGRVLIPPTVAEELREVAPRSAELDAAIRAGWLEVREARNVALVAELACELDAGESEATALACKSGFALLLIAEREGRAAAIGRGLEVVGTGGILLRAKASGMIEQARSLLDWLLAHTTFRLHPSVYADILRRAGESL